jgi:inner membrane transporter RhtA
VAGDLSYRSRSVRLIRPTGRYSARAPEALFLVSAIAQYIGALIAIGLFASVAPQTVAWFRAIGAALALLIISPGFWKGWSATQLRSAAIFGLATAAMNLFFYLAISRIDLGKSVAIEFIGPILVAAWLTRTRRNAAALAIAAIGVVILGGTEIADNAWGLVFIVAASAMWAVYIVVGATVARLDRQLSGLGVGLAIGAVVMTPIGAPGSGPVWVAPGLLLAALATGVFSNAIGYGIDQIVLRAIPIRRFSVMLALLPATAVIMGWIWLGQRPIALEWLGIGLVLTALVIQQRDVLSAPDPGRTTHQVP